MVWNGPMGVFEMPPFDGGTKAVAEAVVAATKAGATSHYRRRGTAPRRSSSSGWPTEVSHVSTGGGASLAMLEGKPFEALEALDRT